MSMSAAQRRWSLGRDGLAARPSPRLDSLIEAAPTLGPGGRDQLLESARAAAAALRHDPAVGSRDAGADVARLHSALEAFERAIAGLDPHPALAAWQLGQAALRLRTGVLQARQAAAATPASEQALLAALSGEAEALAGADRGKAGLAREAVQAWVPLLVT